MMTMKRRREGLPGNMQTMGSRTIFPEAVDKILEIAPEDRVVSISELAHLTSLNRKTVEKAGDLIMHLEKEFGEKQFVLIEAKGRRLVSAKKREPGLLSLPPDLQRTIIRSVYFPLPSREEEILTNLYLRGARDGKTAVSLGSFEGSNGLISTLVGQGHVAESGDRYYLTSDGATIAIGALDLYPELKVEMHKTIA